MKTTTIKINDGQTVREFSIELPFYYTDMEGQRVSRVEPDGENLINTSLTSTGINKAPFRSLPVDGVLCDAYAWLNVYWSLEDIRYNVGGRAHKEMEMAFIKKYGKLPYAPEVPGVIEILEPSQY